MILIIIIVNSKGEALRIIDTIENTSIEKQLPVKDSTKKKKKKTHLSLSL